jgi:hypothetical protein
VEASFLYNLKDSSPMHNYYKEDYVYIYISEANAWQKYKGPFFEELLVATMKSIDGCGFLLADSEVIHLAH